MVVGLSGGVDSVVLTHLLATHGCDVRAAHIDHALRDDAAQDARFAENFAASLGVEFASTTLDVRRGNSTQGRARAQRYAALVRLTVSMGADALCVAHHADDAWESSELQRARGAGTVGRGGPTAESSWWGLPLLRPLLHVRRAWVLRYAAEHRLTWREDPTNSDPHYARTRIRQRDDVDLMELARRRADAAEVAASVRPVARRSPLRVAWLRDELRALSDDAVAHLLIDAARELHGELPMAVVDAAVVVLRQQKVRPQRHCGRRVVVQIDATHVTVEATRGHGTRLLDAATVKRVPLSNDATIPWFDHLVTASAQPMDDAIAVPFGAELGVATPGVRLGEQSVRQLLAEHRVPMLVRARWPCVFVDDHCVAVLGFASLPPPERAAGMFVRSQQF